MARPARLERATSRSATWRPGTETLAARNRRGLVPAPCGVRRWGSNGEGKRESDLLGERSGPRPREWSDDPGSKIWRAGLTHPVLQSMLESVETLAPFLKLSRDVVFAMLRDLVIEEAERSRFGLVAIEEGAKAMTPGDARHGPPRAPVWAVALDTADRSSG